MAKIVFAPQAAEKIRGLPSDKSLLRGIWRGLERAADDPSQILPPAFPYKWPMVEIKAYDDAGQLWVFTALVANDANEMRVILITGMPFPDDLDPADF